MVHGWSKVSHRKSEGKTLKVLDFTGTVGKASHQLVE